MTRAARGRYRDHRRTRMANRNQPFGKVIWNDAYDSTTRGLGRDGSVADRDRLGLLFGSLVVHHVRLPGGVRECGTGRGDRDRRPAGIAIETVVRVGSQPQKSAGHHAVRVRHNRRLGRICLSESQLLPAFLRQQLLWVTPLIPRAPGVHKEHTRRANQPGTRLLQMPLSRRKHGVFVGRVSRFRNFQSREDHNHFPRSRGFQLHSARAPSLTTAVSAAPQGPKQISPGQSAAPPRVPETGRSLALQGQHNRRTNSRYSTIFSPLQGGEYVFWPDTQGVALG
jgi:hypothetical protein